MTTAIPEVRGYYIVSDRDRVRHHTVAPDAASALCNIRRQNPVWTWETSKKGSGYYVYVASTDERVLVRWDEKEQKAEIIWPGQM